MKPEELKVPPIDWMSNEAQTSLIWMLKILKRFIDDNEEQLDMPPEFIKMVDDNFWDLI